MKLGRVFPRKTRATPVDALAYYDTPDMFAEADEVHVSVAFTYDLPKAEQLAKAWERIAPVKIGGPAMGVPGGEFIPGRYLKPGYVITSRGCNNKCWFCSVWKRENGVKELPIVDGWNVLDDNLLACSRPHIESVFAMLRRQKHRIEFTGGLEAKLLEDWHVDLLVSLGAKPTVFFAYDTPDDWEPLVVATNKLRQAGFTTASHSMRCYVLIGYPKDSTAEAESRLTETAHIGLTPMAMLWRDESGKTSQRWRQLQRRWARPAIIHGNPSNKAQAK